MDLVARDSIMKSLSHRTRPELRFSPARTGDEVFYVVEDRISHRFWKIGLLEYEVCSALVGKHSIPNAAALLARESKLGAAAGVNKLTSVGMWLLQIGLVETVGNDSAKLDGEPPKPDAAKPVRMFDPSFFRIPILSSEVIQRYSAGLTWLISTPCLVIAFIVWCVGLTMAYQNGEQLLVLGKKLFVPGSQWWLLVAWLLLKAVHEAGHAIATTKVGAKSKGAGIGFMFFAPSPYVDVTSLWSVPNRWLRVLVSGAGMLFEITLAAMAIICACLIDNPTVKYLCFSIASLGTFTTIAFNGNPLMRYDGYYILIDLIDRPNLWQDASHSMKAYLSNWICSRHSSHSWSIPLLVYGVCCWISRMLLMATMGWGMWMTWDGLGLLVVAFFACLWLVIPQVKRLRVAAKAGRSLSFRSLLIPFCPRKATRLLGVVGLLALCALLPSPLQIYWPAIVEYVEPSDVRTITTGFVEEVLVHDGQGVQAGDEILRLSNPDMELEFQTAKSMLRASEEKCIALRAQRKHSELQSEESLRESFLVKADSLATKVNALHVKAPSDGVLIARNSRNLLGSFISEGHSIGMVVNPSEIEVSASIPQYAWETIAHHVDASVAITMFNGEQRTGRIRKTLPRTTEVLESPALGGLYGGPIAVVQSKAANGESQLKSCHPRLQTRIELISCPGLPPPPGALCSVKLVSQNETVWQTIYRWIVAGLHTRFHEKNK